ncbi:hypothetical protein GOD90_29015 [Sinorhizobium medicae]|nr:hypothetical protein [Sinorhizobium medicae]MDX0469423.1 hypothetical protein [Sinorhizobium medicae]MDX0475746.1 hypothetical protein [Sinorhizobium medicae]MDX0900932.1 hypothetical protein [Sinorhizobium medicae]MDX1176543.1 hypothetical protein [Sinorhizobium medicae]
MYERRGGPDKLPRQKYRDKLLTARLNGRKEDADGFGWWVRKTAEEGAQLKPRGRLTLSGEQEGDRVLAALLNAIYMFAKCGQKELRERIRTITTHFRSVVEIWPASLLPVTGCLNRMAQELGLDISKHDILPTLLDLRSL